MGVTNTFSTLLLLLSAYRFVGYAWNVLRPGLRQTALFLQAGVVLTTVMLAALYYVAPPLLQLATVAGESKRGVQQRPLDEVVRLNLTSSYVLGVALFLATSYYILCIALFVRDIVAPIVQQPLRLLPPGREASLDLRDRRP